MIVYNYEFLLQDNGKKNFWSFECLVLLLDDGWIYKLNDIAI